MVGVGNIGSDKMFLIGLIGEQDLTEFRLCFLAVEMEEIEELLSSILLLLLDLTVVMMLMLLFWSFSCLVGRFLTSLAFSPPLGKILRLIWEIFDDL